MSEVTDVEFDPSLFLNPAMLFHITALVNLPSIIASRRLESAARLVAKESASTGMLSNVRAVSAAISERVTLNAQVPLRGWKKPGIERYLMHLNMHVYFWPWSPIAEYSGNAKKKNRGIKHASAYGAKYLCNTEPEWSRVLLAAPRRALEAANSARGPRFSICNSGAPDRSANLSSLIETVFTASREEGVEVVFRDEAALPAGTMVWNRRLSQWADLWTAVAVAELTAAPLPSSPGTTALRTKSNTT